MRRLGVVDLEASGQCALGELVRVEAEEGVVVAQQGVVDGAVRVCQQEVLVLLDHLLKGAGLTIIILFCISHIDSETDRSSPPLTFTTIAA